MAHVIFSVFTVTQEGKVYGCGEATNGRLGLGITGGTVQVPRQLSALSQYVIKKIAVHSGKGFFSNKHRNEVILLSQKGACFTVYA